MEGDGGREVHCMRKERRRGKEKGWKIKTEGGRERQREGEEGGREGGREGRRAIN